MEGLIMRGHHPSTVLFFAISTSLLTFLWPCAQGWSGSAEETARTGIISGLTGQATTQGPGSALEPRPLKFRDIIVSGEQVATEAAATVEILWGKTTLLTLFEQSMVLITTEQPGQTVVRLTAGTIRVAVAASEIGPEDSVILETPTARVVTRGGILQASATPVTRTGSVRDLQQESFVHHVSYPYLSQTIAAAASATETVQVLDGEADVITGGSTPERRSIKKGQELSLEGGRFMEQTEARQPPERPVLLAAVSPHALTPAEATLKLVGDQQAVAAQLGRKLTGEKEESEISTGASTKNTILSTTFGAPGSGSQRADINLPGFPGAAAGISPPGTGVVDPPGDAIPGAFVSVASQLKLPNLNVQGGGGLLLFNRSSPTGKEYVLIDGGKIETDFTKFPTLNPLLQGQDRDNAVRTYKTTAAGLGTAAHNGVEPSARLILDSFFGGNGELILRNLGEFLPPDQFGRRDSSANQATGTKVFFNASSNLEAIRALGEHGTNPGYDPSEFSRPRFEADKLFLGVDQGFTNANFPTSGIDANIRARSSSDTNLPPFAPNSTDTTLPNGRVLADRTVVLKGGVVFHDSTVIATPTSFTGQFKDQLNGVNSSIAALIGRDETGIETGSLPAFVRMQDRMLAVLNGSSIAPADPTTTQVSLLTVLDSQLRGPTQPPDLFPGDPQPAGVPNGKARVDVPPLIELIDSRSSLADPSFAVVSQSAVTMRAELDTALLEASAPLMSLINSTARTTGDFSHISGTTAQLTVNVPNDQLVLRGAVQLNGSTLSVGGHLFNITDGAKASMMGNLVALANGSTLNVAGGLVNVGAGSSFSLAGGSLVSFGVGTNSVNIGGGTCSGCVARTNIPNLAAGLPIVAHPSSTITVQEGFVPFAGVGAGTTSSGQAFKNTVNLPQGNMGALVVDQNATLTLKR